MSRKHALFTLDADKQVRFMEAKLSSNFVLIFHLETLCQGHGFSSWDL